MKDHNQPAIDEKRILDILSIGLPTKFQNPNRVGCPASAILEGIASHRLTLSETGRWLDHFGSCSPCFLEFTAIRKRLRTRRRIKLGGILTTLIAVVALWFSQRHHSAPVVATLDLHAYSVERGPQSLDSRPELEIRRGMRHLILYLPMGSKEGDYDLVLINKAGDELLRARGTAQLENHVVVLKADIDLSDMPGGLCLLGMRQLGSEWILFPVRLR